jgi:uncharacterized protein YdiU (UPF0061 family)
MAADAPTPLAVDDWFARTLPELHRPWAAIPPSDPQLLVCNNTLATELGIDPQWLASPAGIAAVTGAVVPDGATPVAQAYAGHQFGGFNPLLGDGRALLVGEVVGPDGRHRDLHLKGSGRTPFARGGDGKAAVGPMLREYLMGEAMHALGIPTSRMLAVVATGDQVVRDTVLPGAVLVRVASSHLRVGTFQFAAMHPDPGVLVRLADHAIARHYPQCADADHRYVALLDAVIAAQADLVAQWMVVGFIHGVMNTDNTTISGETIDYGPCALMERFDPACVFSSIDHAGRYAYGNQPAITRWNLARLAEAMLALLNDDTDAAVEVATASLQRFDDTYQARWRTHLAAKLGYGDTLPADADVLDDLVGVLAAGGVDLTTFFRALGQAADGDTAAVRAMVDDPAPLDAWLVRWRAGLPAGAAAAMDAINACYIPRNHHTERVLAAATAGDLGPFTELLDAVTHPFTPRARFAHLAEPAPPDAPAHVTFCGT